MAITKTTKDFITNTSSTSELFVWRVMTVEKRTESRNWSDTMDYTDFRSTTCTYALVWLGTHNLPPEVLRGSPARPVVDSYLVSYDAIPEHAAGEVRDLEFFEQFAWVDCTNLHADRSSIYLTATEDAMQGEPLMWANYVAWKAYTEALTEKNIRDLEEARSAREKAEAEKAAKEMARAKAKADKEEASRIAAEAMLVTLPGKGTTLTVGGFTGVVFWRGTTKYRGKWSARVGVRNTKGEVEWVDGAALVA